jgi:hypothetical protein
LTEKDAEGWEIVAATRETPTPPLKERKMSLKSLLSPRSKKTPPTSPRITAPTAAAAEPAAGDPPKLCTICAKRPPKHRATTKSGQKIVLCVKCATAIRNKSKAKHQAADSAGQNISISSSTNAELAAMANATAAGAATLKRVNNKVCQRCNQKAALLKANLGTRTVILCELCVADVREHRLARSKRTPLPATTATPATTTTPPPPTTTTTMPLSSKSARPGNSSNVVTPTGTCQRCNVAEATRTQPRGDGTVSHVCAACAAKATLVAKR